MGGCAHVDTHLLMSARVDGIRGWVAVCAHMLACANDRHASCAVPQWRSVERAKQRSTVVLTTHSMEEAEVRRGVWYEK